MVGWRILPGAVTSWETDGSPPPGDVLVAAGIATHHAPNGVTSPNGYDLIGQLVSDRFADVTAIYPSRSEFAANMPLDVLFDSAQEICAAGLSLNLICQQFADQQTRALLEAGTRLRCLFLDPQGEAIAAREREERYPPAHLSALTALNIQIMQQRVRERVTPAARERLEIVVYDETIRFNLIIVDGQTAVVQPYLPERRGVDAPTFVIAKRSPTAGLFPVFEHLFTSLWERRRPL
jgi:Domain of unknown function (DUF5919)